jgi:hypothetical protein
MNLNGIEVWPVLGLFGKHMILRRLLKAFVLLWMHIHMIPQGLVVSEERRTLRVVPPPLWETGSRCGGTPSFTTEDTENAKDLRGNGGGIPPGFLPFSSMHMNLKGIAAWAVLVCPVSI